MTFGSAIDAREQLRRWDAGETIWTIEMSGMGPGYEQAIQTLAIEIVRDEIDTPIPDPVPQDWGYATLGRIDAGRSDGKPACGGYSGGQLGAARFLAYKWLTIGPAALLREIEIDRHIQASTSWPQAPKVGAQA